MTLTVYITVSYTHLDVYKRQRMESVKVFGIVDITVLAAGSMFLGEVHEPIKGTKNPQKMLNSGILYACFGAL